ncbi:MAG: type IX secretion system outer membrane channel protein PorV [Balneolaceae bacterium]|nr:type IX secretion system outer membrane channel protein PorV [Balneolaceae bacterium]
MIRKFLFTLSLVLIALPLSLSAQVGITSVPFLQIEPDSRAAGMGNTGVAIADNASAVFWNPAGLGFQRGSQVSITHSEWLPKFNADLFYDYLVGKTYLGGSTTLGAHITYLNLGEQINTDAGGNNLGRFNSYEFAGGLSIGTQLNANWAVGTGVRFIYSSLASGTTVNSQQVDPGSSIGVDLATMYRSPAFAFFGNQANVNLGLNISNLGSGLNYTENAEKDPLPTTFRIGWALTTELDQEGINTLTFSNDISKVLARVDDNGEAHGMFEALVSSWGTYTRETGQGTATLNTFQQFMYAAGLEYWYNELFAVRGGYYYEDPNNGDRQFFTMGAGLRYKFFGVDFSYIHTLEEEHPLANTMRFSLLLNM